MLVSVPSCMLLREHRSHYARSELALIIPQIGSITLYDLHITEPHDSTWLEHAISAPFPVDVFTRAAKSAQHHSGTTLWKGSSLAVLTLSDGTQRRAILVTTGASSHLRASTDVSSSLPLPSFRTDSVASSRSVSFRNAMNETKLKRSSSRPGTHGLQPGERRISIPFHRHLLRGNGGRREGKRFQRGGSRKGP